MERAVLVSAVVCALLAAAAASSSMCEGIWKIDKLEKCENPEQYEYKLEYSKRKYDRNTDCFSMTIEFPEDFGPEYLIRMESYEKCDGGYKASDIYVGGACETVNQFAKDNFRELLSNAGVENQDCPIPKGKYVIKDYIIDYLSLPEQGKCGDYKWEVYIIKDNIKRTCLTAYTTFSPKESEEDEDE